MFARRRRLFSCSRRRGSRLSAYSADAATSPYAAIAGEVLEERRLLAFMGEIELQLVADGLSAPVTATHAGDGSGRIFVAEQGGRIQVVENGGVRETPLLDISSQIVTGGERGLLGLAFHPDFATPDAAGENAFYVYYSTAASGEGNHDSVISEFRVIPGETPVADPESERELLRFSQPFSNHNGGDLQFGPDDGLLYISTGDGGAGGDPQNNAQNRGNLLGNILRIDVNGTGGPGGQYGIPAGNPFVGEAGVREEIFAYGFRNPFRMSFDDGPDGAASPDRLFVGDVGQNAWEEVDLVTAGGNYGWRIREGAHPFNTNDPDPGNLIDPIAEYPNPEKGAAVIGGFVYRGEQFPSLQGVYVFGDLTGRVFVLDESGGEFALSEPDVVGGNPIGDGILGFGEDEAGEIYLLTPDAMLHVTVNEPDPPPPAPWRNPGIAEDVDGNGAVDIADLLAIVQFLRDNGPTLLPHPEEGFAPPPYLDANGDRSATVADLLSVVQVLRSQIESEEEGEAIPPLVEALNPIVLDLLAREEVSRRM
jgi:glucose/arabinose dehydrogenase